MNETKRLSSTCLYLAHRLRETEEERDEAWEDVAIYKTECGRLEKEKNEEMQKMNKEKISIEDVLKAWKDVDPYFKYRDKGVYKNGVRIICHNKIFYEINTEQVYSNRKEFSMGVDKSLRAINLTVEYLKQKEVTNE